MNIGRLDICLRVKSAAESEAFYQKLGFHRAEGNPSEGWVVVTNAEARIGLFEAQYMETDHCLNFRDGNVPDIVTTLSEGGIPLDKPLRGAPERGYSATLRDPDGHVIFLDSAVSEQGSLHSSLTANLNETLAGIQQLDRVRQKATEDFTHSAI